MFILLFIHLAIACHIVLIGLIMKYMHNQCMVVLTTYITVVDTLDTLIECLVFTIKNATTDI